MLIIYFFQFKIFQKIFCKKLSQKIDKIWGNLCYYLNVNKIIIKRFFINKELQFVIDCKINIAINYSIKEIYP